MNSLRWILLLVGIVILLLIYWRGRRAGARKKESQPAIGPVAVTPVEDDAEDLSRLAGQMRVHDDLAAPSMPANPDLENNPAVPVQEDTAGDKLIVLYLTSGYGGFKGPDVLEAMEDAGMQFGDMHIFHCYNTAGDKTLFSVANLVEPGTFDLEGIQQLVTPGLTLFLQLPTAMPSVQAFDRFIQVAEQLRKHLQGELKDHHRNLLTRQAITHMREETIEFDRRQALRHKIRH